MHKRTQRPGKFDHTLLVRNKMFSRKGSDASCAAHLPYNLRKEAIRAESTAQQCVQDRAAVNAEQFNDVCIYSTTAGTYSSTQD